MSHSRKKKQWCPEMTRRLACLNSVTGELQLVHAFYNACLQCLTPPKFFSHTLDGHWWDLEAVCRWNSSKFSILSVKLFPVLLKITVCHGNWVLCGNIAMYQMHLLLEHTSLKEVWKSLYCIIIDREMETFILSHCSRQIISTANH